MYVMYVKYISFLSYWSQFDAYKQQTFLVGRTDSIESEKVIQFINRIIYDVPISLDAEDLVL